MSRRPRPVRAWASGLLARVALAVLPWVARCPDAAVLALGRAAGALLWATAGARRRVALRNLELCFPDWPAARRRALAREHFGCLGRSLVDHALLWHAPPERLRRLIRLEGPADHADRHPDQPLMWLVPHFVGLDVAAVALQLFLRREGATIYQRQSEPHFDAAMRAGRLRFGRAQLFARQEGAKPLIRAVRGGAAFFNLPDMDFGRKDAGFVPFFGVPAATLLAPARMARLLGMAVQPVVVTLDPERLGWRVRFHPPLEGYPGADDLQDAARLNRWIEARILEAPAQYLWVHKRFKTRPPGEPKLYPPARRR